MKVKVLYGGKLELHPNLKSQLEKEIASQAGRLERFFKNYPKPVELQAHLSREGSGVYTLAYSLGLRNGVVVYAAERGRELLPLAKELYPKFKRALKRQLQLERKQYLYERKERRRKSTQLLFEHLRQHHHQSEQESFYNLFARMTPSLRKYLKRQWKEALAERQITAPLIDFQGLLDELYAFVYERFRSDVVTDATFETWVYEQVEDFLTQKLEALDAEVPRSLSVEELGEEEMAALEEAFSANAEGQPTLLEEFDDISYHNEEYTLEDLFPTEEEERQWLSVLDGEETTDWDIARISRHIKMALARLPREQRAVFDLHVQEKLSPAEIARIKHLDEKRVEELLREARARVVDFLVQKGILQPRKATAETNG